MSTRQQRRDARLARNLSRFFEQMASLSAAVAAGQDRLAAQRLGPLLDAGRALAEVVADLHENYRPPVRSRRNQRR